jgi:hypothetical protein
VSGYFAGVWKNDSMRDLIRWVVAAAALVLLRAGGSIPSWRLVASSVLAAGVLTLGLHWSQSGWMRAFVAVFVLEFVVGTVNTLDEAAFFHVMPNRQLVGAFALGFVASVVVAALLSLVPPLRGVSNVDPHPPLRVFARVLALAFVYFVLYLVAGILVRPYVIAFYQSRPLPGLGVLFTVELVRGFLYVLAAWPWLRMITSRARTVLFLGAAYSILGGLAPLLLPNPFMPPNIRLAHGFEVGISNFVFGAMVGWALASKPHISTTESVRV